MGWKTRNVRIDRLNTQDLELLSGDIAAVLYQNAENGYAVIRLNCADQTVTVVGTIPMAAAVGRELRLYLRGQLMIGMG